MNTKKTKKEIEDEFKIQLLTSILEQYNLTIEKVAYSEVCTINFAKNKNTYAEYLNEAKYNNISVNPQVSKILGIEHTVEQHLYERENKIKKEVIAFIFEAVRENLSEEKFIKFLDNKISKDEYYYESDNKSIINYLIDNAPELLVSYINRPKYLMKNYELIVPIVFEFIKEQNEREEIVDTLLEIGQLKDINNQNNIYKIIQTYITNKEKYSHYFEYIENNKTEDFLSDCILAVKIDIDFERINAFNLITRQYTSNNELSSLVEVVLKNLSIHKNMLGYTDYTSEVSGKKISIYFDGSDINEKVLKQSLNLAIKKALSENELSKAYQTKLENSEILNFFLKDKLSIKEDSRKRKI